MSRLHHFLLLSLIAACFAYPLLTRQPAPGSPTEETNEAAPPLATSQPVNPEQAVRDDKTMKASVDALARMETDATRRARTASKTYQVRTELSTKAQSAWSTMIATNTPIYLTLHRAASQDDHHETPCTICDGKGYMHYCILCESSKGQCVSCQGTGLTPTGEDCPVCLGKKKCYLCYGTGKMPCVFCDDGTITLRTINPPKGLPIHCPEPAELLLAEAKGEKEKKSEIMNTVSGWIDQGPSLQQAILEDQVQLAAEAPPSVWVRQRDELLLMLVCALALPLIIPALRPHDAEAELRELSGKYLVDGKEMANFNMPAWFAPGALQPAWENHPDENREDSKAAGEDPVAGFFQLAPQRLAEIHTVLKELDLTGPLETRQEALFKAHGLVCSLKEKSTSFELRPAWQLISSLELLIKRVADKPKDLTASIIRTFATGIDMLHEVCVPGVRSMLLIDPPIRILAVDDDPLCRRALQFALAKANFLTDLAEDGEKAVDLALVNTYDVVFMDIQMPGTDGLTACGLIHQTKKNPDVPVVFVTVQTDFDTRAEARLMGGSDLMSKPFLVFELTVRAVIYATRNRLQASRAGRTAPALLETPVRLKPETPTSPANDSATSPDQPLAGVVSTSQVAPEMS